MHLNSSIDKKMTTLNILFKTTSLCLAMALLVGCNDNDAMIQAHQHREVTKL